MAPHGVAAGPPGSPPGPAGGPAVHDETVMSTPDKSFDPHAYWETRHVKLAGDLRNVGNRGLTADQNRDLITTKASIVCHALGLHGVRRGARLLDAGCGAGVFTEMLQQAGFRMTGIDVSASAVENARRTGQAEYTNATLSGYRPERPFDVVLCLDVLFHVVDDGEWARSVGNLASCVAPDGLLMFIETFDHTGLGSAPHVLWRRREAYAPVLADAGFAVIDEVEFQYPHERVNKTLSIARRA